MTHVFVEAGFGYTITDPGSIVWTDISEFADVVAAGISITGGASDEVSEIQPATCSMTLDNSDGRFTPGLATSPYYPNVKKNCPIRVSIVTPDPGGDEVSRRFYGMVNDWPVKWAGLMATSTITCTDLFKWLSKDEELPPLLVEEILADAPLAYYPLTEPADSTTGGDLSGTTAGPLTIAQAGAGGELTFAGGTGPAATGQGAVLFTPASASAGKYLTADLGADFQAAADNFLFMECWFAASTADRVMFALRSSDGGRELVFSLDGTGALQVEYESGGSGLITASIGATGNLADGEPHWLLYDEWHSDIYIDDQPAINVVADAMVGLRHLTVGARNADRLWAGSVSHLALYAPTPFGVPASVYTPHYTAGADGFTGDTAAERIERLAGYAEVASVTVVGTVFDTQASQGAGGSTALAMMRQVEATENARLYASRDSYGLTLESRDQRYNPTPDYTIAWADTETNDAEASDDDQKMVNTVTASRPGGATQRVVDTAARAIYGPAPRTLDLLKTTDIAVTDAANWMVSRYADPPPELRQVVIEGYSLGTTAYRQVLGLGINSVLAITNLPSQAPATEMTVFIEGYTETITEGRHLFTFHTSRSLNDNAWVLDDPEYAILDATTRLAY